MPTRHTEHANGTGAAAASSIPKLPPLADHQAGAGSSGEGAAADDAARASSADHQGASSGSCTAISSSSNSEAPSPRGAGGNQQQQQQALRGSRQQPGGAGDGPAGSPAKSANRGGIAQQRRAALQAPPGDRSPGEASESPGKLRRSHQRRSTQGESGIGHSLYQQAKMWQEQQQMLQKVYSLGGAYSGYMQWRLRHKIPEGQKVFCMAGSGNHSTGIRAGLLARGWYENPDHNSLYYDFKWAVSPQDINQDAMWASQVVNHFGKATCITTKVGLCRTVRELAWYEAADFRAFYPRGYDLGEEEDRRAFMADVRVTAAEAVVKRAVADGGCRGEANVAALVDLPTLRLALRVCVARLAHDRHLRATNTAAEGAAAAEGAEQQDGDEAASPPQTPPEAASAAAAAVGPQRAARGRGGPAAAGVCVPAAGEAQLSAGEWTQLLDHACITSAAPQYPTPAFDPALAQDRHFITSCHSPRRKGRRRRTKHRAGGGAANPAASAPEATDQQQQGGADGEGGSGAGGADGAVSSSSSDGSDNDDASSSSSGDEDSGGESGSEQGDDVDESSSSHGRRHRSEAEQAGGAGGAGVDQFDLDRLAVDLGPPLLTTDDAEIGSLDEGQALQLAQQVVDALSTWHVQTHINGMNNIWIVKPAGKSRGRGIRLFNNLEQLLTYIKGDDALQLEWRWIAQKYVERPLIISSRKFDIRQWVLVTDWNPLTVWFWDTCYLRFAADDYDATNLDIYLHLSNNSIAKYYDKQKEDEITVNGNMWTVERFKEWLQETFGDGGLWETVIQPAMKHIVICTTKCAQDMVKARKNSCQLYGYDFLIDDQLRVWLLEINSSPTLESSTEITTELCAEVQDDILKVVVDMPQENARRAAEGLRKVSPRGFDTGKFECIVDGGEELKPPTYVGLTMELKGKGLGSRKPAPQAPVPLVPSCYQAYSQQLANSRQQQADASGPGGSHLSSAYAAQQLHQGALTGQRTAGVSPMKARAGGGGGEGDGRGGRQQHQQQEGPTARGAAGASPVKQRKRGGPAASPAKAGAAARRSGASGNDADESAAVTASPGRQEPSPVDDNAGTDVTGGTCTLPQLPRSPSSPAPPAAQQRQAHAGSGASSILLPPAAGSVAADVPHGGGARRRLSSMDSLPKTTGVRASYPSRAGTRASYSGQPEDGVGPLRLSLASHLSLQPHRGTATAAAAAAVAAEPGGGAGGSLPPPAQAAVAAGASGMPLVSSMLVMRRSQSSLPPGAAAAAAAAVNPALGPLRMTSGFGRTPGLAVVGSSAIQATGAGGVLALQPASRQSPRRFSLVGEERRL